jgi:hypothetical protein
MIRMRDEKLGLFGWSFEKMILKFERRKLVLTALKVLFLLALVGVCIFELEKGE